MQITQINLTFAPKYQAMQLEQKIITHLFRKKGDKNIGDYYAEYLLPDFFDSVEANAIISTLKSYYSLYLRVPDLSELKYFHADQHKVSYNEDTALYYKQVEKLLAKEITEFVEDKFKLKMIEFVNNHYEAKAESVEVKTPADIKLMTKWRAKGVHIIEDIINNRFEQDNVGMTTLTNVGLDRDRYAAYGLRKGFELFYPKRKTFEIGSIFTVSAMAKGLKSILLMNLAVDLFRNGYYVIYLQTDTNTLFRLKSAMARMLLKKDEDWLMQTPAEEIDGELESRMEDIRNYWSGAADLKIRDGEKRLSVLLKEVEELVQGRKIKDKPFVLITDQTYFCISREKERNSNLRDYQNLEHVYREIVEFLKLNGGIGLDAAHIDTETTRNMAMITSPERPVQLRGGQSIPNAADMICVNYRDEKDLKASTMRFYVKINRGGEGMYNAKDFKPLYFDKNTLRIYEIPVAKYEELTADVDIETNTDNTASDDDALFLSGIYG